METNRENLTLPRQTSRPAAPSWAKAAMCCVPSAPSTAPTANVACGCRCIAAVSCVLPVAPGAIWRRRVRSGVRSSSARRPCKDLQPVSSASHTAASRRRGCPGSQWQQPGHARQIRRHRVRLLQLVLTWPSSSRPSRLLCRAAAAKCTCSSAAFPSNWRSSWASAMRLRAPGRMPPATGAGAVWSFPTPCRTGGS